MSKSDGIFKINDKAWIVSENNLHVGIVFFEKYNIYVIVTFWETYINAFKTFREAVIESYFMIQTENEYRNYKTLIN